MECYTRGPVQDNVRERLYEPISATEYRVVHLLPGRYLDEIQCVLETRSFWVKSRYEALSYQWGDERNTKPLRVANYKSSDQPTLGILTKALPEGVTRSVEEAFEILQEAAKRYTTHWWILAWSLATGFLLRFLLLHPGERPDWVPSFIPRNVYFALLCILSGQGFFYLLRYTFGLMIEVMETKAWRLAYDFSISRLGQQGGGRPLAFETLQVTANLELALRHLRRENGPRALWVDALCINQEHEDEKCVQIQQMDRIYANASPVIVWLGGYHGLGEVDTCMGSSLIEGLQCEHRRQIQAAFDYIWVLSGWRLLFGWYFNRDKGNRFQESRSGLCEIARRGWWERLWVIQEVALATGCVKIQCGYNTCDLEDIRSAHCSILLQYPEDNALKEDFRPSEHFLNMIRNFRYSYYHDHEKFSAQQSPLAVEKLIGPLLRPAPNDVTQFHKQRFAQRLQRILLQTAGRFSCRDDRDRLYAVLSIAGGATIGEVTKMANFIKAISNCSASTMLAQLLDSLLKTSSLPVRAAGIVLVVMYSLWWSFYESTARHWAINRPSYIVTGHQEAVSAIAGRPRAIFSRVEVFVAIARYLARETKSLAFLDAATCGEDKDEEMPSWVPNWSREVSKSAYDFASRLEKDQIPGTFEFAEDGKTLQLCGRSRGRVNILRPAGFDLQYSSPCQFAFEKVLVLPSEGKRAVADAVKFLATIIDQRTFSLLNEVEKQRISQLISLAFKLLKICLESGSALLRASPTTMVYTSDTRELGFLRAGEAVNGDQLVFVPSCFHHLVLRRQGRTAGTSIRWKLVGLVAMATATAQGGGCSESEWAQLLKDRAVHRYTVE